MRDVIGDGTDERLRVCVLDYVPAVGIPTEVRHAERQHRACGIERRQLHRLGRPGQAVHQLVQRLRVSRHFAAWRRHCRDGRAK